MKKKYETKTEEDEYGYYKEMNMEYDLKDGWEITKTERIPMKGGFFEPSRIAHIYHIRRDITPTKITIDVPAWAVKLKKVDMWVIDNKQLIDKGLLKEDVK